MQLLSYIPETCLKQHTLTRPSCRPTRPRAGLAAGLGPELPKRLGQIFRNFPESRRTRRSRHYKFMAAGIRGLGNLIDSASSDGRYASLRPANTYRGVEVEILGRRA